MNVNTNIIFIKIHYECQVICFRGNLESFTYRTQDRMYLSSVCVLDAKHKSCCRGVQISSKCLSALPGQQGSQRVAEEAEWWKASKCQH